RSRPSADHTAEDPGGAGAEGATSRHRVAPRAPAFRPANRLRPLGLEVRSGRSIEERRLQLAPATFEVDPGKARPRLRLVARDRPHDRPDIERRAARVVAADALLGRAAEIEGLAVEVGVRSGSRMHHKVRAADTLQLLVLPRRPLGALVLAVAD